MGIFEIEFIKRKTMNGISFIAQDLANNVNQLIQNTNSLKSLKPSTIPANFQPFAVSALGNFPYYWQDPTNLKFNAKTYRWIAANLLANSLPVQLDSFFTNYFIDALGSISYSLSTADQTQLNQDSANATNQQGALLLSWQNAFGSLPTGAGQPIDLIMQTITQTWANPPTTLQQLQSSTNINAILNQIPPSGISILPSLTNYLNAIGSSISLLNAITMNRGYLENALSAVQNPNSTNGGLSLNDGTIEPAFAVATPLQTILAGLNTNNVNNAFTSQMVVSATSSTQYAVAIDNQKAVTVNSSQFLTAINSDNQDIFQTLVAADSTSAQVTIDFTGITTVFFGPVAFSQSALKNWYWMTPITNAILNGSQDVSGFKFSPNPQIDFSKSGPFAFLTGVAISKSPTLNVLTQGNSYQKLASIIESNPSVTVNLLGNALGNSQPLNYNATTNVDDNNSIIQVNFQQSGTVAGDSINSTAFVLGVQTNYPAS
jgi:hypothetical protein